MASIRSVSCCLLICVFSVASVSAQLLCRDRPDLTLAQCNEYFQKGGIRTILEELDNVGDFDDALRLTFLESIATVSDEYVILTVTSTQVVLTDVSLGSSGMVEVSFFVLNPSGSLSVPTAFRSEELYLMMTLNDNKVEEYFGQAVKPVDPSPETLAIPVWAIAILVYAGIVVLIGGALFATRDYRKLRQQNLERSLQMESVETGKVPYSTNLPMSEMKKNGSAVRTKPVVAYAEAGVGTSPSLRVKARAAKKAEMASNGDIKTTKRELESTVAATVEVNDVATTPMEKDDDLPLPPPPQDNDLPPPPQNDDLPPPPKTVEEDLPPPPKTEDDHQDTATPSTVDKDTDPIVADKHEDAAPEEGVVNKAFDNDDEDDDSEDEGAQSYQITDIDQVDDDGNPIEVSDEDDEGDTQF